MLLSPRSYPRPGTVRSRVMRRFFHWKTSRWPDYSQRAVRTFPHKKPFEKTQSLRNSHLRGCSSGWTTVSTRTVSSISRCGDDWSRTSIGGIAPMPMSWRTKPSIASPARWSKPASSPRRRRPVTATSSPDSSSWRTTVVTAGSSHSTNRATAAAPNPAASASSNPTTVRRFRRNVSTVSTAAWKNCGRNSATWPLSTYRDVRRQRIERRRDLARRLGITMNALAVRACRLRDALMTCVEGCSREPRKM